MNIEPWISFYKRILCRAMNKDLLLPHNCLWPCVQGTQSPVGNMYFQQEASVHTYGVLATAVLSKTYSGVYQLKYEPT